MSKILTLAGLLSALALGYSETSAASIRCESAFLKGTDSLIEELPPSVLESGVTLRRARICYSGASCVVFMEKPQIKEPEPEKVALLMGEEGEFYHDSALNQNPSINCHGFSCHLSGIPGLPPNSWIHGFAAESTDGKNSLQVLLDKFFVKIGKHALWDDGVLERSPHLQDGDLVTFINALDEHVHSGIVVTKQENGKRRNWIVNKTGEGPAVIVPLTRISEVYPYSRLEIYRRKPQ